MRVRTKRTNLHGIRRPKGFLGPHLTACGFIHDASLTSYAVENNMERHQTVIKATKAVYHLHHMSTERSCTIALLIPHRSERIKAHAVEPIYLDCVIDNATYARVR